jgi:hypothetical protein
LLHAAIGARARLLRATVEPIAHRVVRETTAGLERMKVVYRASSDDLTERACDVVIKRLRGDAATDDPHRERFMPAAAETHPNYWRREYDAYDASSPIASLPAPLRAPRCYAREIGDANATLWLESIDREPATDWPDERFYDIARAFGAWRSAREPRWLARGSLRMWAPGVDSPAYAALADSEAWTSPRVAGAFGRDVFDDVHPTGSRRWKARCSRDIATARATSRPKRSSVRIARMRSSGSDFWRALSCDPRRMLPSATNSRNATVARSMRCSMRERRSFARRSDQMLRI